jgi:hypothetical protein
VNLSFDAAPSHQKLGSNLAHFQTTSGWWLPSPSEKYEFVNGKDDIPYIMENKKCSKPPTRKLFNTKPTS